MKRQCTTEELWQWKFPRESKESVVMLQPPVQSVVSKVLKSASVPPTIKYPDTMPKSSACVLTSEEEKH